MKLKSLYLKISKIHPFMPKRKPKFALNSHYTIGNDYDRTMVSNWWEPDSCEPDSCENWWYYKFASDMISIVLYVNASSIIELANTCCLVEVSIEIFWFLCFYRPNFVKKCYINCVCTLKVSQFSGISATSKANVDKMLYFVII